MADRKVQIPWHQDSYYEGVEQWIRQELKGADLELKGKLEPVKDTDVTLVLRIPTYEEDYYFKAGTFASKHEAVLSSELQKRYPRKTVDVLSANEPENWLLMKDLKGESLRTLKDKKLWQKAISEYAELQMAEMKSVDRLMQVGVPDRRMPVLKEEIHQSLEEMCKTGLSRNETKQVMSLLPILLEMCDELDSIIPPSIEHGDLHTNNIRLVGDRLVFFDWGDASISHPFFSTRVFWHALDDLISDDSEWLGMVEEFRPHYLEPWTKLAPMKDLDRALRISDELACVQRALSWHLYITPNRKNQAESYNKPSQWLRLLLEHRVLVGK
ncbi:phosphotransferase [Falsibacillus pallidus]|uniref:Aminoglycoside phosphotransferase (APT) family kinase protein n=1 Tax=Falsibacillus pallidus TaxID=493781 RepID=A0A370GG62_9BACI|nr:phosphotransferase [Falsibacillus pallidus]RDI40953.1 aminoglycoside phosphotransferase (APT) family kinase protein [Falsibacillus pallidus]